MSGIFQGAVTRRVGSSSLLNVLSLLLFRGYRRVPSLDVKQLGDEAEHSSPSSAKVT